MGAYNQIINAVRAAATAVLPPTGDFIHGRIVDASQYVIDGRMPLIVLYPFTIGSGRVDDPTGAAKGVLFGFWMQDAPDSSMDDRQAIISQMDDLADAFLNALAEEIGVANWLKEPQYQFYNGTVSGVALSCDLTVVGIC